FFSDRKTLDCLPIPITAVINAYDPDSVWCGTFIVHTEWQYGFLPVYRDDPTTSELDEGADPGDTISFNINGNPVTLLGPGEPVWTYNGDIIQINLEGFSNYDPVITSTADTTATEDQFYSYTVTATDVEGDTLVYSLTIQPSWLSIDSASGVVSGTPTNDDVGDTIIAVKVEDGHGGQDTQTYTLYVSNTNDPPVITTTSLTDATEDVAYLYSVVASDVDIGDILTFSLFLSPSWLSIGGSTGMLSGTPTNDDVGTNIQIIVKVHDLSEASDTLDTYINVRNTNDPPVISGFPNSITFRSDTTHSINLNDYVEDPDNSDSSLLWSVTGNDSVTVIIDPSTNIAELSASLTFSGRDTLVFTVSDDSSAWDNDTVLVRVIPYFQVLSSPIGLTAVPGDQVILLSWFPNIEPYVHQYRIYRDHFSPALTLIDSVLHPDTTFSDAGLTNGQTYYYRISAVADVGNESGYSSEVSIVPVSKEIALSESYHNFGDVQVDSTASWTFHIRNIGTDTLIVSNITNTLSIYSISTTSGHVNPGDSLAVTVVFLPSAITSYPDTLHVYSDDVDLEDQVKIVRLTAAGIDTVAPIAPVSVTSQVASHIIAINWASNKEGDLEKYLIHKGVGAPADSVVTEIFAPDTVYMDTNVVRDAEYYYYVTAVDTIGNISNPSDTIVSIAVASDIEISATALDLGEVQIDSVNTDTITIFNAGNFPLTISEVKNSNPSFSLSDSSFVILPNDSTQLIISFQAMNVRTYFDTLMIESDDFDEIDRLLFIYLSATGIDTVAPLAPTNVTSQVAPQMITINWASNEERDLEKYLIHREVNAPGDSVIAEILAPDTVFIDTDILRDIEYYYFVSAVDAVGNISAPSDTTMAVAVNSPPAMIMLTDLSQELHGNIHLQLLVEDIENDDIEYGYYFSTDSLIWNIPTLADISDSNTTAIIDTLEFTWLSEEDLGENEIHDVYLKVEAFDSFDTTIYISDPINVDNYVGKLIIGPIQELDEYSETIDFPYEIIDTTNDHYILSISYSVDSGYSWNIAGMLTDLDSTMYLDTLKWNSLNDLMNYDGEVIVAFALNDGWQYGVGDTLTLYLDNQFLPAITKVELAEHWYEPIRFTFNKEIDFGTLQEGLYFSSRHGVYEDLEMDYNVFNNVLIINNPSGWFTGDTLDIEITTGVKDIFGNPFDGNGNDDPDSTGDDILYTVSIGLLGDYDESDLIDFDDLITFQQLWFSDTLETSDEIGPAEGTPPYLQIVPDNKFDFEDLMIFVQMWNWSAGFDYGGNLLAKTIKTSNEDLSLDISYPSIDNENYKFNVHLNVSDFMNVGALELTIQYDTTDIIFNKTVLHLDESWIMLSNVNTEEGKLVINMADLNKDIRIVSGKPFTLNFTGKKDTETSLVWQADIRIRSGLIKYQSSEKFTFNTTAQIPKTYALHQNYPNPFNPSTTIRYDLPEDGYVHLIIYNILGQEVVSLVNKQESAGFHSIIWNSKNRYGKMVSPGIYFYLLKTDHFTSAKKLVLLK
ncbi:MAG: DUF1573 domain-containing protein, partial [Candidatus Marinimicrobia bacterium]|nr:DUF1573 domain-containing protein [Candidatus Neomarinimicrobiota bacterium]